MDFVTKLPGTQSGRGNETTLWVNCRPTHQVLHTFYDEGNWGPYGINSPRLYLKKWSQCMRIQFDHYDRDPGLRQISGGHFRKLWVCDRLLWIWLGRTITAHLSGNLEREIKKLMAKSYSIIQSSMELQKRSRVHWEREDQFREKYPHLFTKTAPSKNKNCCILSLGTRLS
ncbi:hypothetical protein Tco_0648177 [Tanacetum coccineum]